MTFWQFICRLTAKTLHYFFGMRLSVALGARGVAAIVSGEAAIEILAREDLNRRLRYEKKTF